MKRISAGIYEEVRGVLKGYLESVCCQIFQALSLSTSGLGYLILMSVQVLRDVVLYTEYRQAKTVTTTDVSHIPCRCCDNIAPTHTYIGHPCPEEKRDPDLWFRVRGRVTFSCQEAMNNALTTYDHDEMWRYVFFYGVNGKPALCIWWELFIEQLDRVGD